MQKPKFKMSISEMLDFNDACEDALRACPQRRYGRFEDRQIFQGEVSAKELVKTWSKDETLWHSGYHYCLSNDALDVFIKYNSYKAAKKQWKAQQPQQAQKAW